MTSLRRKAIALEMEGTASDREAGERLLMLLLSELLYESEPCQLKQALYMLAQSGEARSLLRIFCTREVRELELLGLSRFDI